ncbi:MAG: PAS domain-containing protein [Deltaproteobacteria bacterium]|nr:PAS domain-containing protein [Deltaproteobacteria bacterium]
MTTTADSTSARRLSELAEEVHRLVSESTSLPREDPVSEIRRGLLRLRAERDDALDRLRATEQRFQRFADMSPDAVAEAEAESLTLLSFNPVLCRMLRRSPTDLEQAPFDSLFQSSAEAAELLGRLRETPRLRDCEAELRRGDGSSFPALLTLALVERGGEPRIELMARDVSASRESQRKDRDQTQTLVDLYGELSRAHDALQTAYGEVEERVARQTAELRHAYDSLRASDQVKTEFLMKMSHELRTPLNCIIGYSEAMTEGLDGPVSGRQAQSLARIADNGRRLLRMIEDLLDLSRLESGQLEFVFSALDVGDALQDVLHQARSLVARRPIGLELSLSEPLPPVWADPDRLRQVVFNLVGNALKFTDQGFVRVEARRVPTAGVEVRVCDSGPGVPSDQAETIFERFTQLPGRDRSGAGLGLSICRELVEGMGGKIWVQDGIGGGSVFTFTLPVAPSPSQLTLPFHRGGTSPLLDTGDPPA